MTRVTISDEATRSVVEAALWHAIEGVDALWDDLYGCGVAAMRCDFDFRELVTKVEGKFIEFDWLREDLRDVRSAALGDEIHLHETAERFSASVTACQGVVEDWKEFWKQPEEIRNAVIARRDAAVRLVAELHPTEAVA